MRNCGTLSAPAENLSGPSLECYLVLNLLMVNRMLNLLIGPSLTDLRSES